MADVPEDIRAAADSLVRGLCCDTCQFMNGCGCFDRIAQALMAEREQAAKIADAHSECERDCGDVIADAIRRGTA
jgi:hypothetical protein